MAWNKQDLIPESEITVKITDGTVKFAQRFGSYLGTDDPNPKTGKPSGNKLTTNQLRKFFGEVKRQQMSGYDQTDFVLLKPKLAYAVGRAKQKDSKIKDFYVVISDAIDKVHNEQHFKNFIKIFEAIVAYHKAAEEKMNV
jgi:CRISPR-associated protein Csm2